MEDSLPPKTPSDNHKIFTLLGKIFVGLMIIIVLVGTGYYLKSFIGGKIEEVPMVVSPEPVVDISIIPQATMASSPTAVLGRTLSYKFENSTYILQAPEGWELTQEKENYTTDITISDGKAALIIRINQATEGAPCGFPDALLTPSEMFPDVSEFTYNTYSEFKGSQGQFYRRVDITANPSVGKNFFAVCQKRDKDWMKPTGFGFVTYEVPYSDNPEKTSVETLKILDAMFAGLSLK